MEENNSASSQTLNNPHNGNKFSISKLPAVPVIGGIVLIIVVVVVVAVMSLYFAKPDPEIAKYVASGNQAVKSGDYNKSKEEFKKALNIKDDIAAAQVGLINSYSLEGNQTGTEKKQLEVSKELIEKALKDHPNDPDVLIAAGYAYEGAGDYSKALEYYKKATEKAPNSAQAWFHLGHVSQFLGKLADSQNYYNKAYELDPKNPAVNMVRANTFFSEKKLTEAYSSYKVAANNNNISDGERAEALAGAATVLLNMEDFKYIGQADQIAKKAVEADSSFAPALGVYGFTRYLMGDNEQALINLSKATEANPRISKNFNYLGLINRSVNNLPTAVDNFNSAIKAAENDNTIFTPEARTFNKGMYSFELAKTYDLMGNNAEALAALEQAVAIEPKVRERLTGEVTYTDSFASLESNPDFQSLIN